MKRKGNKKNYPESDNFDRKAKKHSAKKEKSSKRKLSIYDEFEEDDLLDYSYKGNDDFEDEDDE